MHLCIFSYIHISSLVKKLSVQFARLEIVLPFTEKLFHYTLCSFQRTFLSLLLFRSSLKIKQLNSRSLFPQTSILQLLLLLRKEVIQPHLPIRLPCYDFTPIIDPTFDGSLLNGQATGFGCYQLSWCDGRCVQGPGTYSPRYADPRLLAIPTSCRRVAACNPN